MKTALGFILALVTVTTPALAQDKQPLTVEQCIIILNGLNSLNWAGQQLNETMDKKPTDAKQYKLGETRFAIAENVQALTPVFSAYQRGQQQFMAELPTIPDYDHGAADHPKPVPPEIQQMVAEQNKKSTANQIAGLARPCNVTPGRIKLSELRLGDDADHNAIPPSVLAAISPIVDR